MSKKHQLMFIGCLGAAFAVFAFFAQWVYQRDVVNELRAKASCVERGGKVVEFTGGLTRYSCEGPTRF